jgi:hypothetical protein
MTTDGLLRGGPCDGRNVDSDGRNLIEVEIDQVIHRYIRTTQQHGEADVTLTVFTYDGAVDPVHASDGAEHVGNRTASPLAAGRDEDGNE